jgi:hypothetical protein
MHEGLHESANSIILLQTFYGKFMTSWKKALALALGLPSTIIGVFFAFQEVVKLGYISQGVAQGILIAVVLIFLTKMILVSWKKK